MSLSENYILKWLHPMEMNFFILMKHLNKYWVILFPSNNLFVNIHFVKNVNVFQSLQQHRSLQYFLLKVNLWFLLLRGSFNALLNNILIIWICFLMKLFYWFYFFLWLNIFFVLERSCLLFEHWFKVVKKEPIIKWFPELIWMLRLFFLIILHLKLRGFRLFY